MATPVCAIFSAFMLVDFQGHVLDLANNINPVISQTRNPTLTANQQVRLSCRIPTFELNPISPSGLLLPSTGGTPSSHRSCRDLRVLLFCLGTQAPVPAPCSCKPWEHPRPPSRLSLIASTLRLPGASRTSHQSLVQKIMINL
jgi:hypothetical protein